MLVHWQLAVKIDLLMACKDLPVDQHILSSNSSSFFSIYVQYLILKSLMVRGICT